MLLAAIQTMTLLEGLAVILAVLYIILAIKENIWCWVAGFFSTLIYMGLFFQSQLYSETLLQVFYLIVSVYGWWNWKHMAVNLKRKAVSKISLKSHVLIISFGGVTAVILGYFSQRYLTASLPYVDATTTVFAIITTYMVTQKIIDNWLYWIVIDALSIYMYINKDFYLTVLLFSLYIILSITGYYSWKKHLLRT